LARADYGYDASGALTDIGHYTSGGLTRELLRGDNGGTPYSFGERSVEFDKAGGGPSRRSKATTGRAT